MLLSDAELNEGNVWEAVQFAGQHRLDGLTALIDLNGQQALDFTADVIAFSDVRALLEAHGWEAVDVPGTITQPLARRWMRRAPGAPARS